MKRNAYTCLSCAATIVTQDREAGTTPFMLGCLATEKCQGMMQSHFYRGDVVESDQPATHEWRKPSKAEYRKSTKAMRQHLDLGGLNIYKLHAADTDK